jgi:hypothetical protein
MKLKIKIAKMRDYGKMIKPYLKITKMKGVQELKKKKRK